MPKTVTPLFDMSETSDQNVVDFLRSCFKVVPVGDANTPTLKYRTNDGKGSGPQHIPLTELRSAADAILECIGAGGTEAQAEDYVPADVMVRRTFRVVEDDEGVQYYCYNTQSGKGSKPARIPVAQAEEFVAAFGGRVEALIAKAIEKGFLAAEDATDEDAEAEEEMILIDEDEDGDEG